MEPSVHQKDFVGQYYFLAVVTLIVVIVAFVGAEIYHPLAIAGLWLWMGTVLYVTSEDVFVRE